MKQYLLSLVTWALAAVMPGLCAAQDITLPFERFTLDNGLRVIVHEDRKAPVVAVSIWYHVGSADEPAGKKGFAHLFEHLMFNGSEHYDGEWFAPLLEAGATGINGTTWFDRTNYYQTVPVSAIDRVLWMESDRMGYLTGALTQEKLDNQRDVVRNEKNQGDNRPYGRAGYAVLEGLFPAEHPYRHATIGLMEDLDAASLEDAAEWFSTYYGASNAVLVLAGDIDAEEAKPLVEKYFSGIRPGPPLTKTRTNIPVTGNNRYATMYERVSQPRMDRTWVTPGRTSPDAVLLGLAARVLGGGKTSRLYRHLVDDMQIATMATANMQPHQLAGFFSVTVDACSDIQAERIRKETDAVIDRFLERGITRRELDRARTAVRAGIVRSLETAAGKAQILAAGELYTGNPAFILEQLEQIETATPAKVLKAAKHVMQDGYFQLDILPYPEHASLSPESKEQAESIRNAGLPPAGKMPPFVFPQVAQASLSNGMRVILAERKTVPVVEIQIQFDAGYAADSVTGSIQGLASFTGALLDEGTASRNAIAIAADLEELGATLDTRSTPDTTDITLSALAGNLRPSLDILADVVRNPAFRDSETEKLRKQWLAGIEREKEDPAKLALRLLPPEVYGKEHAYGTPMTGSGTADSIRSLSREDLKAFYASFIRPDNATILVAGDISMHALLPELERAFGSWKAPAVPVPVKNIAPVKRPAHGKIIVIDKPGATQSLILAGHVAPPSGTPDNVAIMAMNDIIGGQFTSRINMNLREEKGWSYGAFTFLNGARGQRLFMAYAPVEKEKTAPAITELIRELKEFRSARPATGEETEQAILSGTKSLPGSFETARSILSSLSDSNRYGREFDYPATLPEAYGALKAGDIAGTAAAVIHPESLIFIIITDYQETGEDIRNLENTQAVEVRSFDDL